MNVPLPQPAAVVEKLNVPVAVVPRYARAPLPIMVPLVEPDVKATETLRLDPIPELTWPLTLNVVPEVAIAGKQDDGGLFTAVTVPLRLLPFWLKLTVNPVLGGGVEPCVPEGANVIFHAPVTIGV